MTQAISTLMHHPVHTVKMGDSVAHVHALLVDRHLSWVPVLEPDSGEVAGVISAADLIAFHAQGRDASATQAWQMCSYKPIVVDADKPAAEVAALMVARNVHHVVVLDGSRLAGVVSSFDFLRVAAAASPRAPQA